MSTSSSNSWLRGQRKSDLVEVADHIGLTNYESLKKVELEVALDRYLTQNSPAFSADPRVAGFFQSQAKARGSPVKKEAPDDAERPLRSAKRRSTRAPEDFSPDDDVRGSAAAVSSALTTSALTTTPRNLSMATRIPLPATPADVALAVDRSATAVRTRVATAYHDSGITDAAHSARDSLSTVPAVLLTVAAVELYFLRRELLADTYAFTLPAMPPLTSTDHPVHVPDMFLLLTSSFWYPALLWLATSFLVPAALGYFYNLSANRERPGRGRRAGPEYAVDPLTFSVAKALVSYVVYAQGVTFCGLVDETSVGRINEGVYGGWRGVLVGCAITGLTSVYDAILRK